MPPLQILGKRTVRTCAGYKCNLSDWNLFTLLFECRARYVLQKVPCFAVLETKLYLTAFSLQLIPQSFIVTTWVWSLLRFVWGNIFPITSKEKLKFLPSLPFKTLIQKTCFDSHICQTSLPSSFFFLLKNSPTVRAQPFAYENCLSCTERRLVLTQ